MARPNKSMASLGDTYEGMLLIGDHNWQKYKAAPVINGVQQRKGYKPPTEIERAETLLLPNRKPLSAVDIPLIPEDQWDDLISQGEREKSFLSDMVEGIDSRDQNGRGYCWAHSVVSCMIALRAKMNLAYADLSAYMIACIIKNFADQGGWGALALDFATEKGCATSKTWPQQGTSRSLVNDAMYQEAALYKVTEGWIDTAEAVYDRNLSFKQCMSLLLARVPLVLDYNWWGHSVCGLKPVRISQGKYGILIWNSWGNGWSQNGRGVLEGSKAVPNGCTAPRSMRAT